MPVLTARITTQLTGYSAADWAADNRILHTNQVSINSDDGRKKQGDGVTPWVSLPYLDTQAAATAQIGFGTGAGGAVSQATSKTTGVTLHKPVGQITMNAASLAAATVVSFVATNSLVGPNDVIVVNHVSGGSPGSYTINARAANGSFTVDVRNNTAGALAEAIVISYVVVKGAVA